MQTHRIGDEQARLLLREAPAAAQPLCAQRGDPCDAQLLPPSDPASQPASHVPTPHATEYAASAPSCRERQRLSRRQLAGLCQLSGQGPHLFWVRFVLVSGPRAVAMGVPSSSGP